MPAKKFYIAAHEVLSSDEEVTLIGYLQDHLKGVVVHKLSEEPDVIVYSSAGLQDSYPVRDGLEAFAFAFSQNNMSIQPLSLGFGRGANALNTFNGGTNVKTKGHYLIDDTGNNSDDGSVYHELEYFGKNKKDTFGTRVNSFHQSEMKPPSNGKEKHHPYGVLAKTIRNSLTIEALWYPVSRSICIQWSPEYDPDGGSGKMVDRILEDYGDS